MSFETARYNLSFFIQPVIFFFNSRTTVAAVRERAAETKTLFSSEQTPLKTPKTSRITKKTLS
jgi:hypothetical protein